MKNKKGLSDVVVTVLIILLALAAVAIIWSFVKPAIESAGGQLNTAGCLTFEVAPVECKTAGTVKFKHVSGSLEGLDEVRLIFDEGGVTRTLSAIQDSTNDLTEFGTKTYTMGAGETNPTTTETFTVAAIFKGNACEKHPEPVTCVA